ncbi:MAG TPA: hypothetical protein VG013_28230 [Gemmataceae bacterium]|nr:hypothetical protein [Gemmataceae bacterium]
MATALTRDPWTVDDLLAAVKQLPPADLREFQRQFAAWSAQNGEVEGTSSPKGDEEALLAVIRENSGLLAAEQRRFNQLRRKRQGGTLTEAQEKQLQALWSRVEQMNVARLAALIELARRRGTNVRTLMRQLGLPENRDAF